MGSNRISSNTSRQILLGYPQFQHFLKALRIQIVHCESKKDQRHFINNFAKCWSIFIILSPLDSGVVKNMTGDLLQTAAESKGEKNFENWRTFGKVMNKNKNIAGLS